MLYNIEVSDDIFDVVWAFGITDFVLCVGDYAIYLFDINNNVICKHII